MIKIMKSYANDDKDQLLAEVDGELRHCPFCGNEGIIYGDGEHYWTAGCSKCPVEITEIYFTLEEAVWEWNRRAGDD